MYDKSFILSFLFLVPNISLDVLQPSFPEILLESHMVMIRVLWPPPVWWFLYELWAVPRFGSQISSHCLRSAAPYGRLWECLHLLV